MAVGGIAAPGIGRTAAGAVATSHHGVAVGLGAARRPGAAPGCEVGHTLLEIVPAAGERR